MSLQNCMWLVLWNIFNITSFLPGSCGIKCIELKHVQCSLKYRCSNISVDTDQRLKLGKIFQCAFLVWIQTANSHCWKRLCWICLDLKLCMKLWCFLYHCIYLTFIDVKAEFDFNCCINPLTWYIVTPKMTKEQKSQNTFMLLFWAFATCSTNARWTVFAKDM